MITPDDSLPTLTVVIAAGQSRNPEKRELEDTIAARLLADISNVKVIRAPHLYDLAGDSKTYQQLKQITGDMVVLSWLFDRASHWTLDRNGVRGQVGEVLLRDDSDEAEEVVEHEPSEDSVTSQQPRPSRSIYCIDLKVSNRADDFTHEITRIFDECRSRLPGPQLLRMNDLVERYHHPTNDTYVGVGDAASSTAPKSAMASPFTLENVISIDETPGRRWYPVIDFSRCTNCMECIDFCLFGVYGVDAQETIVVEQADNCRKGCPACSRVCPQNAIMFPQHKTPAIAGAPVDVGGLKIDLSKLFGAPESNEDAAAVAARERDEQLMLAGRAAVGSSPASGGTAKPGKGDDLDHLIDELDALDL